MLDGIKADRPQLERLVHGGLDVLKPEALEQPQDLDVFPLAGLAHARLQQAAQRPECLGQLPALQRCRLVERADLLLQQRQVMQRVEDELLALIGARVPGDDRRPAGDHHLLDIAPHQHRAVAIGGRHRVVVAVVAHQRQCRDPGRFAVAGLIGGWWSRLQGRQIAHQPLADALVMAANPVIQPLQTALFEMCIERGEAGRDRNRHQEVAPGIADQALDFALVVALARPAEAVQEQVMRLQLGKGARALARAVAEDACDRQPGIVVQDRLRHAAEKGEGGIVPVQKGLGALGRVGFDEAGIRVGQVEAEEVDRLPDAADHRHCLAEVGLGMAGRVGQRHKHLLGPGTLLAHIVLHDRVAAGIAVLGRAGARRCAWPCAAASAAPSGRPPGSGR